MKCSQTCACLLTLLGVVLAVEACATGTKADVSDVPPIVEPKKTTEPTEPPPESVTVPPPNVEDASTLSPVDAGEDASPISSQTSANADAGVVVPDAGSSCAKVAPSNACGLAPQCGCGARETCDVTDMSTGAVSCVAAGDRATGSVCSSTAECGPGLTCAYGACRPYCAEANAACTGAGLGICNQGYNSAGKAVPNAKVCTVTCDLLNPSGTCGSNNCIWDKTLKATDCDSPGMRTANQPCTVYNDCAPGLACAPHPQLGAQCAKWCRIGHDDECAAMQTCKDVYGADAPKQGSDTLGHCQQ